MRRPRRLAEQYSSTFDTEIGISFDELFAELQERAKARPEGSSTVAALDAGVHAQGKKVLEEAGEVWLAAEHEMRSARAHPRRRADHRGRVPLPGAAH